MLSLEQSLDLPRLLDSAQPLLPRWAEGHPALDGLDSAAGVTAATRQGSEADRDNVLIALAELASPGGGDSPEAAALLCQLLIPAVVSTLLAGISGARGLSRDDVTNLVAAQLWVAVRTFPWRTHRKVAVSIQWTVRRAVLAELGFTNHLVRVDRTWAATSAATAQRFDALVVDDGEVPAERQLELLLATAVERGVVSRADVELLWTLVLESQQASGRYTSCGLMSEQVSELVGARMGVAGRTVRRRAARALERLRVMVASERDDGHVVDGRGVAA